MQGSDASLRIAMRFRRKEVETRTLEVETSLDKFSCSRKVGDFFKQTRNVKQSEEIGTDQISLENRWIKEHKNLD